MRIRTFSNRRRSNALYDRFASQGNTGTQFWKPFAFLM